MLKILITGPECSGKTSLAHALAGHFKSPLVPELARAYLTLNERSYQQEDLAHLARNQLALEQSCLGLSAPYLFVDTSMLVLQIWSKYRYNLVDEIISENFRSGAYDLCFLCQPVEPYVPDDLRENPNDRWSLYYLYLKELSFHGKKPQILDGSELLRFQMAKSMVSQLV